MSYEITNPLSHENIYIKGLACAALIGIVALVFEAFVTISLNYGNDFKHFWN